MRLANHISSALKKQNPRTGGRTTLENPNLHLHPHKALPSARLHLLEVPQPSQIKSSAEDQVFKSKDLWGALIFKSPPWAGTRLQVLQGVCVCLSVSVFFFSSCTHVCAPCVCLVRCLELELQHGGESPCNCWALNPGPLKEQDILPATEPAPTLGFISF